jgi:hypothetical protein
MGSPSDAPVERRSTSTGYVSNETWKEPPMIVDVAVRIRADVLPPRARKVALAFVEDRIPIAVRETSAAEAPVALSSNWKDVRCARGLLFVKVFGAIEDWAIASGILDAYAGDRHLSLRRGSPHTIDDFRFLGCEGKVVRSSLDVVAGFVQAHADSELLVIDGDLHRRIRSPLLTMEDLAGSFSRRTLAPLETILRSPVSVWFMDDADAEVLRQLVEKRPSVPDGGSMVAWSRTAMDFRIVDAPALAAARVRAAENTDFVRLVGGIVPSSADFLKFHEDLPVEGRTSMFRGHVHAELRSTPRCGAQLHRQLSAQPRIRCASTVSVPKGPCLR